MHEEQQTAINAMEVVEILLGSHGRGGIKAVKMLYEVAFSDMEAIALVTKESDYIFMYRQMGMQCPESSASKWTSCSCKPPNKAVSI